MSICIGIDPGMYGAVGVLQDGKMEVFDTPLYTPPGKDKKDYDIPAMAEILRPYIGSDVTVVIEAVFSMTGQGVSSSFNFGRGKGLWEGIVGAYGFKIKMVSPQTWKKKYDGLIVHRISKDNKPKTQKEKAEAAKQKRIAKAGAKAKARQLAGQMYPHLASLFEKVNSDGRAESVLIAKYACEDLIK